MKRVLVAGATGYLGGFVAQEIKTRGHFVRALARSPGKLDHLRDSLDEIVQAQVTEPNTLAHVCDGIDVVFSSIGITKQKDGLTFHDVDYQGNKNLLDVALRAGVKKFLYVSVLNGPDLLHLDIVRAHEEFVDELKASIGRGGNGVNPIHGADLAVSCVDALEGERQEIDVGGPETLTYREIAELAFRSLGKPVRITSVPVWVMKLVVAGTKIFNKHQGELLAFFTTAMTSEVIAPAVGTRRLADHFESNVPAG
jgi:uncharacterized protein YbjT (DUF2867 family)